MTNEPLEQPDYDSMRRTIVLRLSTSKRLKALVVEKDLGSYDAAVTYLLDLAEARE